MVSNVNECFQNLSWCIKELDRVADEYEKLQERASRDSQKFYKLKDERQATRCLKEAVSHCNLSYRFKKIADKLEKIGSSMIYISTYRTTTKDMDYTYEYILNAVRKLDPGRLEYIIDISTCTITIFSELIVLT